MLAVKLFIFILRSEMEMRLEVKNPNGNTFLYLEYDQANKWLYANWIGYQSVENVKKGITEILNQLDNLNFSKLLNDNRALIGPWDKANLWLEENVILPVNYNRIKYMAHIISPGIFGQLSVQDLQSRLHNKITIKLFEDIKPAEEWLRSQE